MLKPDAKTKYFRLQTTCYDSKWVAASSCSAAPALPDAHAGDHFRGLVWSLGAEDSRRREGTEVHVCAGAHSPGAGGPELSPKRRNSPGRPGISALPSPRVQPGVRGRSQPLRRRGHAPHLGLRAALWASARPRRVPLPTGGGLRAHESRP